MPFRLWWQGIIPHKSSELILQSSTADPVPDDCHSLGTLTDLKMNKTLSILLRVL